MEIVLGWYDVLGQNFDNPYIFPFLERENSTSVCCSLENMETLEEQEQEQSTTTIVERSTKKTNMSLPSEIIEDIFSRLPVKSILRFRTLSKPWLSRISDRSFTNLHLTRAHRTALFILAHDESGKRHLLSAPRDGGPVTHLITFHNPDYIVMYAQHVNGLVYLTCMKRSNEHRTHVYAFVVNPSMHKIFKLPDPYTDVKDFTRIRYLFGFDESRNEHKILMIRDSSLRSMEIMIFSMSSYSWRKIHAEPPLGFTWDGLWLNFYHNVCVNSVVHIMLAVSFDILAFDLRTEKFLIITTPQGVLPEDYDDTKQNDPYIIKLNGCIGVVCYDSVAENNEMYIWILQDYENRVWVKETVIFPEEWITLRYPLSFPVDSVNMDEIIFIPSNFSGNVISVPVYNKKTRCFKSLRFASGNHFSLSRTLQFHYIRCYVESMVPL
ncbi:putative F-box domain-containing protein [Helianthus annuus]|nr:putative F-box protein At1g50870 [Helianthus annuus]KAJ0924758.1 putative F-box domain-containing protein [Helianthus annuus]